MAGRSSQLKGKAGEREVADMLFYATGKMVTRNLDQTRNGGHDLDGVPGLSIEVKRQERLNINTWWKQTTRQANQVEGIPVLAYRQNYKPWKFIVTNEKVYMDKPTFLDWLNQYLLDNPGAIKI